MIIRQEHTEGKSKMTNFLIILAALLVIIGSAVAHEADMSRNFKKSGDAKAWFFPIRAEDFDGMKR